MDIVLASARTDLRFAMEVLLREQPGMVVTGTATGSEGLLALIETIHPALVILDGDLPGQPIEDVLALYHTHRLGPLVDEHRILMVQDTELILGGLDFALQRERFGLPISTHEQHVTKLMKRIHQQGHPMICMTHHPSAFVPLMKHQIDLVLAGHTHGGCQPV